MMPTYVYECTGCGRQFEETHTVDDRHNARCPDSCGCRVEVLIQPPAVIAYGTRYDIGLGCEVTGPGHRRSVMKALGVEESGNMTLEECQREVERVNDVPRPRRLEKQKLKSGKSFLDVYNRVKAQSEAGTLPPGGFEGA